MPSDLQPHAQPAMPSAGNAPGAPESLQRRAGRGALWAVLHNGAKHGVDLLVFLCLARWLTPEAFGLVAMASAVVVLAAVLAELGLGEALVQRADLHPRHIQSAFWLSLGSGLMLSLTLIISAPFLAAAYGQPELTEVLRCLSPLFLMHALNVVPQALLQRELRFQPLTQRALVGAAAGGITGLIVGANGGGVWSLVAQQLASASTGLLVLWWLNPWRPRASFSAQSTRELLGFSRYVVGARLLNVLASKADDMVVGLVLGPVALGLYSVACRMQLALEQLFCQGIDAVALSAFSRAGTQMELLRALFGKATRTAAAWAFPVFGGAAFFSHELLALAAGPKWAESAPLLQWLLMAGLLQALMHFNHAVFKAVGSPALTLRIALASTGLNIVTLAVGVRYGIEAVAMSCVLRSALLAPVGVTLACRLLGMRLRDYLLGLWRPALGLTLAIGVVMFTDHLSSHSAPWADVLAQPLPRTLILGAAGALVYLASLRISSLLTGRRSAQTGSTPAPRIEQPGLTVL